MGNFFSNSFPSIITWSLSSGTLSLSLFSYYSHPFFFSSPIQTLEIMPLLKKVMKKHGKWFTLTAYDNFQNLFTSFFLLKWHFITAANGRHRNWKVSWAEISGTKIFLLSVPNYFLSPEPLLSLRPHPFHSHQPSNISLLQHFIWTIHNNQTKSIQTLSILFIWNLLERLNKKKVNQRRDSSSWVKKTEDEVVVKTWWTRLLTPSHLNHTFFTFSFCIPSSCFFSLPFTWFHKSVLNRNKIHVMRCNKCSNCSSFLGGRRREESGRCDYSYCTSWIQHLEYNIWRGRENWERQEEMLLQGSH